MKVYATMGSKIAVWIGTVLAAAHVSAQSPSSPSRPAPAPADAAKAAPAVAPQPLPPPLPLPLPSPLVPSINGREIFLDERKGNCAACHKVPNDTGIASQSNIGPSLQAVKSRFPDRAKLREAIWDYSKLKPTTIMPPYGKHRILTDAEIDALVIYLESI
jgi:L-cysteine S-thiosulfotransferase